MKFSTIGNNDEYFVSYEISFLTKQTAYQTI